MAKVPHPSQKMITVYSPAGDAVQETLPNARDLVQGAGYSWTPHAKSSPVDKAPAGVRLKTKGPSAAQEVLDSVGGQNQRNDPNADKEVPEEEEVAPEVDEEFPDLEDENNEGDDA